MKKFFLVFGFFMLVTMIAFGQSANWYFENKALHFEGATPTVVTHGNTHSLGNSSFMTNGYGIDPANPLFVILNDEANKGNWFENFSSGNCFTNKTIVIKLSNNFFLIVFNQYNQNYSLNWWILKKDGNNFTFGNSGEFDDDGNTGNMISGFAVTRPFLGSNHRYLYYNVGNTIYKKEFWFQTQSETIVTGPKIIVKELPTTIGNYTVENNSITMSEFELSPDENNLAFTLGHYNSHAGGHTPNNICLLKDISNTKVLELIEFSTDDMIAGLEFARNNVLLFTKHNHYDNSNNIYKANIPVIQPPAPISGTEGFGNSQLEIDIYGNIWAADLNNNLKAINNNTLQLVSNLTITGINIPSFHYEFYYGGLTLYDDDFTQKVLPGQVDGEITQTTNKGYDLVIYDSNIDPGLESNDYSYQNIWLSPDIWNRNYDDNGTSFQNPVHTDDTPNYLYVRVHNRGLTDYNPGTTPARLKTYWTMARTDELWDLHWKDIDGNRTANGKPKGSEISTIPIDITINSGDSKIIKIPWYPPNPDDYYNEYEIDKCPDGSPDPGVSPMICFLARIEDSKSDPINNESIGPVVQNIKNSNNIATYNGFLLGAHQNILCNKWFTFELTISPNPVEIVISNNSNNSNKIPDVYLGLSKYAYEYAGGKNAELEGFVKVDKTDRVFNVLKSSGGGKKKFGPFYVDTTTVPLPPGYVAGIMLKMDPNEIYEGGTLEVEVINQRTSEALMSFTLLIPDERLISTTSCYVQNPCFETSSDCTIDAATGWNVETSSPDIHCPPYSSARDFWGFDLDPFCSENFAAISSGKAQGNFITETMSNDLITPITEGNYHFHSRMSTGRTRPFPCDIWVYLKNSTTNTTFDVAKITVQYTNPSTWQLIEADFSVPAGESYDKLFITGNPSTTKTLSYVFIDSVDICETEGHNKCDELINEDVDNCCVLNLDFEETFSPITQIACQVQNGTIESLTSSCPHQSSHLATSGKLVFSNPCQSFDVSIDINPDQQDHEIVIWWEVSHQNGDTCRYSSKYICPNDSSSSSECCCISSDFATYSHFQNGIPLGLKGKKITITNNKQPNSIDAMEINFNPPLSNVEGMDLKTDGSIWKTSFNPNSGPIMFNAPGYDVNNQVEFEIYAPNTSNWTGDIEITITYSNDTKCDFVVPDWELIPTSNQLGTITQEKNTGKKNFIAALKMKTTNQEGLSGKFVNWMLFETTTDNYAFWGGSQGWPDTCQNLTGKEKQDCEDAWYGDPKNLPQKITLNQVLYMNPCPHCLFDTATYLVRYLPMQVNKPTTESVEIRCILFDEKEKPIGFYSGFVIDTMDNVVNVNMNDDGKYGFTLLSGIPNPATDRTTVHYYLENSELVYLDLYDESGRFIKSLDSGFKPEGYGTLDIFTAGISSGTYFVRMKSVKGQETSLRIVIYK